MGYNIRQNADGSADLVNSNNATALKLNADATISSPLPAKLPSYTVASVPAAASFTGALIYVSNGAAGSPMVAFSNGTNWLRVDTGGAIAAS